MRLALSLAIFVIGILVTFGDLRPDLMGPFDFLGMFMMLTGAVQIAYIVGGSMLPVTTPATERLYNVENEKRVLWLFAPLVALIGILIKLVWNLITHTP